MKAREKVQKNKKIWEIRLSQTHAIEHSKRFLRYVKNSVYKMLESTWGERKLYFLLIGIWTKVTIPIAVCYCFTKGRACVPLQPSNPHLKEWKDCTGYGYGDWNDVVIRGTEGAAQNSMKSASAIWCTRHTLSLTKILVHVRKRKNSVIQTFYVKQ